MRLHTGRQAQADMQPSVEGFHSRLVRHVDEFCTTERARDAETSAREADAFTLTGPFTLTSPSL
jgi:hypothetical protein